MRLASREPSGGEKGGGIVCLLILGLFLLIAAHPWTW